MSGADQLSLGIDTGGTYTDAVLFSSDSKVLAKAKSLTTKQDLAIGISGAVDAVLQTSQFDPADIGLVSMSTTLATNALVEGKGSSVGLVMIGFDEADMEKAGLAAALGNDPVIFVPGGHDVHGNERPLDLSGLTAFITENENAISGIAVAGYFAVRNTSHELKAKEWFAENSDLPVTCSHELSSKLGGPKRALTTLLNARLIPVIQDLVLACGKHLESTGINAPIMVVRGDGALVDANFALSRPVETILSGPAASLVGAKHLIGESNAVVSDIGGTTTDVAILENGWPRIDPDGAQVGGNRTMVEAVAMHTYGLGGDSEIRIDEENRLTKLKLGPRRQIPVSLLAVDYPDIVFSTLARQEKLGNPGELIAKFAGRVDGAESKIASLKTSELKLFEKLSHMPQAQDQLLKGAAELGTLNRLVSRGFAWVSGLTPSDAMHFLNKQNNWNGEAAAQAIAIFCRIKDRFAKPVAVNPEALAEMIKEQLTQQSCRAILGTCMSEDGINAGPGAWELIARSLQGQDGLVQLRAGLDRTLVGLGASAATYYPAIGEGLKTPCIVPEHADVANAIGAVAGDVRIRRTLEVASADGGSSFKIVGGSSHQIFIEESVAIESARSELSALVEALAKEAGADNPVFDTEISIDAPEIEGSRHFVSASITISASGRPRFAS